MAANPVPFTLDVHDDTVAELHARLERTRLPDRTPGERWAYGTDPDWMRHALDHWRHRFDWRAAEARLNALPQFRVPLDGIDLHFIRVEGQGPDPLPLLLVHGWPGSLIEFLDIIPRLTDPARFGGDPADAVTVIAPSLPGYTLSYRADQPRFGVEEMAATLARLMTDVLGFERFAMQGGDWGSFVTSRIAYERPEHVVGLHLNMVPIRRDPKMLDDPTPEERAYFDELTVFLKEETGYQWIQGTRPDTLAHALIDSPSGLLAWIAEKFQCWTDGGGDPEGAVPLDALLANVSLYWFTGCIGASFFPYWARMHRPWPIPDGGPVTVPTGYAAFPREIVRPPRSLAERTYRDIRRWTVMEKGGHFAALEQPEALAAEVLAFLRPLRR